MPSVMYAGLVVYSILAFGLFAYSFLKERSFALAPSLGWLSFMALPFLVLWGHFPDPYRGIHAQGVLLTGGLMLAADYAAFLYMKHRIGQAAHQHMTPAFLNFAAWGATTALIGIAVYHLAVADNIPLFKLLFGDVGANQYLVERDDFQRDLPVPFFVRYIINFNVYIFGSLALVLHWLSGRRTISVSIAIAIIVYSVLSTAKLPAVIAVTIISGLMLHTLCTKHYKLRAILLAAYVLGMCAVGLFYTLTTPELFNSYKRIPFETAAQDDPRRVDSIGDYIRSPDVDAIYMERPFVYRFVYRVFLTPIEVSNRWYQYFTYVQKTPEPLSSMMGRATGAELPHPSVRVGHWAYHEKFPLKYMPNVHAYASLDADAYAYGGLATVFIAALVFGLVRFAFAVFFTRNPIAETLHMAALMLMMVIPASGSLPALLAPHGLAALLAVMIGVRVWASIRNRRNAVAA